VVGWIVLAPRYEEGSVPEIPVVRRPQTAIKVQPAEPGGMEILNQDKSVYDIVEKQEGEEKMVENLLPPPEEPKIPEIIETDVMEEVEVVEAVVEEPKPAPVKTVAAPKPSVKVNPAPTPAPIKKKKEEVAKEISSIIKVQESIKNKPTSYADSALTQAKMNEPKRIEKVDANPPSEFDMGAPVVPAKKENVTAASSITKPKAAPKPTAAAAGTWQLQLMASQNKVAVEKAFAPMAKKYNILAGHPYEVEEADLGAKGLFYRLKVGAFNNKAAADSLCNDLKAMGGTCIVKKK
jgi:hypothetical protein